MPDFAGLVAASWTTPNSPCVPHAAKSAGKPVYMSVRPDASGGFASGADAAGTRMTLAIARLAGGLKSFGKKRGSGINDSLSLALFRHRSSQRGMA